MSCKNCRIAPHVLLAGLLAYWTSARPAAALADDLPAKRVWVVTVAGLGGDEIQSKRLQDAILGIQKAARERWNVPEEQIRSIPASDSGVAVKLGASREQIADAFADLTKQLQADDAVWLFVFAHGNYDGRNAYLHLAGPDAPPAQWAAWLDALPSREQVVFLTGSGSGWLLKPLARPGRIVVAATAADDEFNATEFPLALVEAANEPLAALDLDQDRRASLAEFFVAIHRAVTKRFAADERIATEHAQLDDDGNGQGTEAEAVERRGKQADAAAPADQGSNPAPRERIDGEIAATIWLPLAPETPQKSPESTENAPSAEAPTDRAP